MRIAMVSEHASPLATLGGVDAGGQNVYVAGLALALAARGHKIDVYTRRDEGDSPSGAAGPGVTVVHVPAGPPDALPKDDLLPYMPEFGRWMAGDWARPGRRPDVLHAHFWMSGVAALSAVRAAGEPIPVAQTFHALGVVKRRHQGAADTSPAGREQTERMLAAAVDVVFASCSDEVAELRRAGAEPAHVRVVPCGVDVTAFAPAPPRLPDRPEGPDQLPDTGSGLLLSVGRLVERKGTDTAVEALTRLPGVHLVIAGGPPEDRFDDDPDVRRLRALAERLGVADRVHLAGPVPHERLRRLMLRADVVVHTPWYEPFGMVPLEAMACGRPVVGTAVGGLLDTVLPGVTGALVTPRDPRALARELHLLLADGAARRAMGRAARRRAVARYRWERVAQDMEAGYLAIGADRRLQPAEAMSARADGWLEQHLVELDEGLAALRSAAGMLDDWGATLARVVGGGGRVLAAGNGGSAAEAQHLTAELVGRFLAERRPLSAVCLSAETSSLTAILNDYGAEEVFARQAEAHGRPGDVLLLLSTSGKSPNVVRAAERGREIGLRVWSMTGPGPNPLADASDQAFCVGARSTAAVQEAHLIAVHALCAAVDVALARDEQVRDVRQLSGRRSA